MVIKSISIKSILCFPVLLVLSWQNVFAESIDSYIARLETKLDVKIVYKKKVKDTWGKSTYQIPTNKTHLLSYLRLIESILTDGYNNLSLNKRLPIGVTHKLHTDNNDSFFPLKYE